MGKVNQSKQMTQLKLHITFQFGRVCFLKKVILVINYPTQENPFSRKMCITHKIDEVAIIFF